MGLSVSCEVLTAALCRGSAQLISFEGVDIVLRASHVIQLLLVPARQR
jgi:hypothetical protein